MNKNEKKTKKKTFFFTDVWKSVIYLCRCVENVYQFVCLKWFLLVVWCCCLSFSISHTLSVISMLPADVATTVVLFCILFCFFFLTLFVLLCFARTMPSIFFVVAAKRVCKVHNIRRLIQNMCVFICTFQLKLAAALWMTFICVVGI